MFADFKRKMTDIEVKTELTGTLWSHDVQTNDGQLKHDVIVLQGAENRKNEYLWINIGVFVFAHLSSFYGIYLIFTGARLYTIIFAICIYLTSGIGITAGVHRLWSHRSYKAKLPLQILLMVLSTIAYENSVTHWAREHRVHHKYSETDADPVNSKRGFFFSHMGWLMVKKHPSVAIKGAGIDISDLTANPVLAFQKKYYAFLMIPLCFILPTVIPMYCWNETLENSWYVATMLRWIFGLHATWLINSAAHKFGSKPYDKRINPSNNDIVTLFTFGEGYHNYHHTFPWDSTTSELGNQTYNATTAFIKFMERIGWAYDLQSVDKEMVKRRVLRTGDGSHIMHSKKNGIFDIKEALANGTEIPMDSEFNEAYKKTLNKAWGAHRQ